MLTATYTWKTAKIIKGESSRHHTVWCQCFAEYGNTNSNSNICRARRTVKPMVHSIVSDRCMMSWTRMSVDDAWMLLSTSVWVSVLSVADSTHEVQRQSTHGRRIAAPSVEERGCCCCRRATTSVMICRRPVWAGRKCSLVRDRLISCGRV